MIIIHIQGFSQCIISYIAIGFACLGGVISYDNDNHYHMNTHSCNNDSHYHMSAHSFGNDNHYHAHLPTYYDNDNHYNMSADSCLTHPWGGNDNHYHLGRVTTKKKKNKY